jgi:hypothetical protein
MLLHWLWLFYALMAVLFMHWLYTSLIGGAGCYTEQPISLDGIYRLVRGGNSATQKVVPLVLEETQAATLDNVGREAIVAKNKLLETLQVK